MQPPRELLDFLFRCDRAVQSLALGLGTVVIREMATSHEYIFAMRSNVVLLYGGTDRVIADCICNISVFRQHVALALHRGTDLDDCDGLLHGTGKRIRHLRLSRLSDLDRPELCGFLRQARRLAGL